MIRPDGEFESFRLPLLPAKDKSSFFGRLAESHRQLAETPGSFIRPFLADFDADAMQTRYRILITDRNEQGIWLEFMPRRSVDLASFNKLRFILDAQSFQPKAMRIDEPGEGAYTTYVFKELKAN
jgi:hypothetical protein